jgi:hypothetical protein
MLLHRIFRDTNMTTGLRFYKFTDPLAKPLSKALIEWVEQLEPDRDQGGSVGPRSLRAWLYHHNFGIEPESPLGTYFGVVGTNPPFRRIVTMATLLVDDRGMRAKYHIPGDYTWGLVQYSSHRHV